MKDGPESAEGVRTASSATNGGGINNGDLLRDKARSIQQAEGSPTTLLAVVAEEVTAGELPLGGTLTLLQRNNETPPNVSSPDTNEDDKGSNGSGKNGSDGKNGEKVFVCGICNRCFGYRHVLQNHERTHTGEKPFECPECHKRFTRDHHLKTHIRLHTGEKPYQCSYCDRHFAQVANLRRHLRTHTGERPYACQICTSRFSDSNQLKSHMLIHSGKKPFQCTECLGRFRRRHHLNHHKCPKDKANIGKPRRGRRPRAYDQLQRSGDEDDPDVLRISENDEEEDALNHNNHSSSETEHPSNNSVSPAQVVPVVNNGRKTNHAMRILTPQQREIFLRDKVSMQTQAIDMRVSSEVPMRTVIVPRFVEGVLDLSNSRSDSESERIDEELLHHNGQNGEDVSNGDMHVDVVNGDMHVDVVNGDLHKEVLDFQGSHVHHQVRTMRSFAIRRTDASPTVLMRHRPTVLVSKIVESVNGSCSSNGHGLEELHKQVNGNSHHFSSEDEDDRKNSLSPHPMSIGKKASIVSA